MPKRKRIKQMPGQRHCHRCKQVNPPEGFYPNGYCKPCARAYYRARYRGPQHERLKEWSREWGRKNKAKIATRMREQRWRLKLETLATYGGICACCKEARPEFLAIDHINGGGNAHRRARSGTAFYLALKREGWPKGLRVLCHNCNMAYGFFGYCPHQQITKASTSTAM